MCQVEQPKDFLKNKEREKKQGAQDTDRHLVTLLQQFPGVTLAAQLSSVQSLSRVRLFATP